MLKLADLANRADFSIGPLKVSPARRLVEGPEREVHVEPLVMQVFLLLLDARGEVVTRNRLFDECWGGVNVGDYSLNRAITMVRRIATDVAPEAFTIENIPRTGYRLLAQGEPKDAGANPMAKWRSWPLLGAGAGALIAAGLGVWTMNRPPAEPTAAVLTSDARSAELLGGIKSAAMTNAAMYQTNLKILDAGAGADFLLKVLEVPSGADRRIDLMLVSGTDESLLWSWSGRRPEADAGLLQQEAKMVGGSALSCAAETGDRVSSAPDEQTVKLYVEACSKFGPWSGADLRLLTDAFQRVTERAPQIRGAWSKLFVSKAEAIDGLPPMDLRDSLNKDIQRAERLHIDLPELDAAKAVLLPPNARFERLKILEDGLAKYPNNLFLLAGRSWLLRSLGRMNEAAMTGQRLASLYPQSSAANSEYANSLMNSGRIDAARNVLDRAAKITPDAANLEASRWILEMRYGDPKAALAEARKGKSVVEEPMIAFLEARINPTRSNVDHAIDELMAGYREYPVEPGWVAQALGTFGRTEEAIQFLLGVPNGNESGGGAEMLFRPHMRAIRRDPRFILIARNFGVTDYWFESGILPDFCFDPSLPYDCRRELAKLRQPARAS